MGLLIDMKKVKLKQFSNFFNLWKKSCTWHMKFLLIEEYYKKKFIKCYFKIIIRQIKNTKKISHISQVQDEFKFFVPLLGHLAIKEISSHVAFFQPAMRW